MLISRSYETMEDTVCKTCGSPVTGLIEHHALLGENYGETEPVPLRCTDKVCTNRARTISDKGWYESRPSKEQSVQRN